MVCRGWQKRWIDESRAPLDGPVKNLRLSNGRLASHAANGLGPQHPKVARLRHKRVPETT